MRKREEVKETERVKEKRRDTCMCVVSLSAICDTCTHALDARLRLKRGFIVLDLP